MSSSSGVCWNRPDWGEAMWNRPRLMMAVSDLLFAVGAASLVVAAVVWGVRLPFFPLREVVFQRELQYVQVLDVEQALSERLHGNFFNVDLNGLRRAIEDLSWVRHAEIRRQWPGRLEVDVEEHQPAAVWGISGRQLVNSYGELFFADVSEAPPRLPVLTGPTGMAQEMLDYFRQAETLLASVKRWPEALEVSPRLALRLMLDDGMVIELGRQQEKAPIRQRLERFVEHYPSVLMAAGQPPSVVDMRYPNGFALRIGAVAATESKGRP